MSNDPDPDTGSRHADLDARIKAARAKRDGTDTGSNPGGGGNQSAGQGLGIAWRISTELVVAVLVGGAIGHFIDNRLGSTPWLLILGLFFGSAAGVLNSYRVMVRLGANQSGDTDRESGA